MIRVIRVLRTSAQEKISFTSITAAAGLKDYAELLKEMGLKSKKSIMKLRKNYERNKNNLMVEGKFLKDIEGIDNSEYEFYDTGIIDF